MNLLERSALYASVGFAVVTIIVSTCLGIACFICLMDAIVNMRDWLTALKLSIKGCFLISAIAISAAYLVSAKRRISADK